MRLANLSPRRRHVSCGFAIGSVIDSVIKTFTTGLQRLCLRSFILRLTSRALPTKHGVSITIPYGMNFRGPVYEGRAWKTVQFKLRRLLYEEILILESMPDYKAARVLGICLNVMGLTLRERNGIERNYATLQTAVLTWTQRNYLRLREVNAQIADACLIGSITFDADNLQLVKTYFGRVEAGAGPGVFTA